MTGNESSKTGASSEAPDWTPPPLDRVAWLFPQFAILGMLGKGSIGAVYQGLNAATSQSVAIKIVGLPISVTAGIPRMFAKTMPAVSQLVHPHIVAVREFGLTAEEHLFSTMELIEGTTLRERIRSRQLTPPQVLSLVEQVCDAVHHAHTQGVIHGGIHPGNIFIDKHGPVKVADFGLSRVVPPLWLKGSRTYFCPELLAGGQADARSDVFSAGVLLYEALTGELPHADSLPASALTGMNPRIDGVIARAMDPSPDARYQDISELMRALAAVRLLCVNEARKSSAPIPVVVTPDVVSAVPVAKAAAVPVPARSSRKPIFIGSAIAAGLAVVAGIAFMDSSRKSAPVAPLVAVDEWPTGTTPPPKAAPVAKPTAIPRTAVVATPAPKGPEKPAPGTWVSVALDSSKLGAPALDGGGVHLTRSVKFDEHRAMDMAARVSIRMLEAEPKAAQLWIRNGGAARIQVVLDGKPSAFLQTTLGESKFRPFGTVSAPWALVGDRWVTLEVAAIGDQIYAAANGRPIPVELKSDVLEAGGIGLYSAGADFKDLAVMILDGAEPAAYPDFIKNILAARLAKATEPAPMTPAPEPAKPAPPQASPEVEKWYADAEKPVLERYQAEIAGPFEVSAGGIRRNYIASLDQQIAATSSAGKLEEAVAWRTERQRFFDNGQKVPADDSDNPLPAIKPMRAAFRTQFGKLDHSRYERARSLFVRFDAQLAQNQELLTQRQRLDDALLIKTKRDALQREWLTPPASVATTTAKAAPASESQKLGMREVADWLIETGAELTMQQGNDWKPLLDARLIPPGRALFRLKVDGTKVKTPYSAEELARLAALRNLTQLELVTAYPTEAFAFLRELSGLTRVQCPGDKLTDAFTDILASQSDLRSIQIRNASGWTGRTLDALAKLPEFHSLDLENSGLNNDGAAAIAKLNGIDELNVRRTKITDIGVAHFARLRNLRRLEIAQCDGVTPEGLSALKGLNKLEFIDFLHDGLPDLAAAVKQMATAFPRVDATRVQGKALGQPQLAAFAAWRGLKHLQIRDSVFAPGGSAALAQLTNLENLELSGTAFGDADVEHLLGLRNLRKLNLTGAKLTDASILKFKEMKNLKELNLNGTAATGEGVRALIDAHPGLKVTRVYSAAPPVAN